MNKARVCQVLVDLRSDPECATLLLKRRWLMVQGKRLLRDTKEAAGVGRYSGWG